VSSRKIDCSGVLAKMKKDFAAEPARLILAMEDALTTEERCAGPIVRTAIDLAGRDPAVTPRLVVAAIRMVPDAAVVITETAMDEAPETVPGIKAALAAELGEKSVPWLASGTSKSKGVESAAVAASDGRTPAGKAPLPVMPEGEKEPSDDDDFPEVFPMVGVSGIFAASPARAARSLPSRSSLPIREIFTVRPRKPRKPVASITSDSPE